MKHERGYKRKRGLRRYFRNLAVRNDFEQAENFDFSNPDKWFDMWHTHFDWMGFGNKSFKRRKPHLDKLFRHFDLLAAGLGQYKRDYQLFALIHDYDSASDALFIHTPNPNYENFAGHMPFPVAFKNLQRESTITNPDLQQYIDSLDGYEKCYGSGDESFCILFKKGLGVPIVGQK